MIKFFAAVGVLACTAGVLVLLLVLGTIAWYWWCATYQLIRCRAIQRRTGSHPPARNPFEMAAAGMRWMFDNLGEMTMGPYRVPSSPFRRISGAYHGNGTGDRVGSRPSTVLTPAVTPAATNMKVW